MNSDKLVEKDLRDQLYSTKRWLNKEQKRFSKKFLYKNKNR